MKLRNRNIHKALTTIGEQWNGAEVVDRFLEVERACRGNPRFRELCETAMRLGRVRFFGLPVILDEEITGEGQGPIVRHLMWLQGDRPHPFPTK